MENRESPLQAQAKLRISHGQPREPLQAQAKLRVSHGQPREPFAGAGNGVLISCYAPLAGDTGRSAATTPTGRQHDANLVHISVASFSLPQWTPEVN